MATRHGVVDRDQVAVRDHLVHLDGEVAEGLAQPQRGGVERRRPPAAGGRRLVLGLVVDGVGMHDRLEVGERGVHHDVHAANAQRLGVGGEERGLWDGRHDMPLKLSTRNCIRYCRL
jgi:hypothetical protein